MELGECIRREYGLIPLSMVPATRGFFGETWRLETDEGAYFLKLHRHEPYKSVYENSFQVIERLCDHGIDFVGRVVKTSAGALCARFGSAVLGVFEWIDGEQRNEDDTKIPEYEMLGRIYAVNGEGLSIPRESFNADSADIFFGYWDLLRNERNDESAERVLALFEEKRDVFTHRAQRLSLFSDRCKTDRSGFFITHGDAGGNVMVNGDKYYIMDWDFPMLAPPERDAWVMMGVEWAKDAFYAALSRNGISYAFRPERLAYYCYHMFFYYSNAYLDEFSRSDVSEEMCAYLNSWMVERIALADSYVI